MKTLILLIVLTELTGNEAISGLGALSILVPYYLLLIFFRKIDYFLIINLI